jgi:hypothetical protein
MRLYEINHELAALWCEINDSDEILPEMTERFNELKMARDEKLKYLGCLLLNEKAENEAIKGEVERMVTRRKRLEAKIESLSGFLMGQLGDEKFSCPQFTLSVRGGPPAVELVDGMAIPSQYVKTKVVESVDKELIKTDLKNGATLPFARLVSNKFLSIK